MNVSSNIRNIISSVPRQPQVQNATCYQIKALQMICHRLGLDGVSDVLDASFQETAARVSDVLRYDMNKVIDLALVESLPHQEVSETMEQQWSASFVLANHFGLYDAADCVRHRI